MRPRDFLGVLGGAAAWPLAARGQQTQKIARIGILGGVSLSDQASAATYQIFLTALRQQGFIEGQNLIVEYRQVTDSRGPFVAAAELMRSQVDLIVADGPEVALQAVVGASRSIPIVIQAVNYDPVERGYVADLAHLGGNITGVFYRQLELAQKQLELLTQPFPQKTRLAVLWDAQSVDQFNAVGPIARTLNLELRPLKLEKPPSISVQHFEPWLKTRRKWSSCSLAHSLPNSAP